MLCESWNTKLIWIQKLLSSQLRLLAGSRIRLGLGCFGSHQKKNVWQEYSCENLWIPLNFFLVTSLKAPQKSVHQSVYNRVLLPKDSFKGGMSGSDISIFQIAVWQFCLQKMSFIQGPNVPRIARWPLDRRAITVVSIRKPGAWLSLQTEPTRFHSAW